MLPKYLKPKNMKSCDTFKKLIFTSEYIYRILQKREKIS